MKVNESAQPDLLGIDLDDQDWPALGSSLSPERHIFEVGSICLKLINSVRGGVVFKLFSL